MLPPRRVALRLGSVFARLYVQVESPLRQSRRGSYRGRLLADGSIRHMAIPALGAMGFCRHFRPRSFCEPIASPSIFSVAAASFVQPIAVLVLLLTAAIAVMSFLPPVRQCFATREA
jgi:hypothetical protein